MHSETETETGNPPLPELWRSVLDNDMLETLLSDLAKVDRVQVVIRQAAMEHVREAKAIFDLDQARAALTAGKAVQLRYRWENAEWWDTLTPSPAGINLVRMRHDR